jgi:hypothetical protein
MQRAAAGVVVGLVVVSLAAVAADPAVAQGGAEVETATSWRPPTWAVPEGRTSVYIEELGGARRTFVNTRADSDFAIDDRGATVLLDARTSDRVDVAPNGSMRPTSVGVALRVPAPAVRWTPGTTFTGLGITDEFDDRGGVMVRTTQTRCDQVVGWFAIDEATYEAGRLVRFVARFEQRCGPNEGPATRGRIAYDASEPDPPTANPIAPIPALLWRPNDAPVDEANRLSYQGDPGEYVTRGASRSWSGDQVVKLRYGEQATPDRDQHFLGFNASGGGREAQLVLRAPQRADRFTAGYYPRLFGLIDDPTRGNVVLSADGRGCVNSGWVAIDEIDVDETGLHDIALRYQHQCLDSSLDQSIARYSRGTLRWQAPSPAGAPAAPTAVTADPAPGRATVTWRAPAGDGATITGYEVIDYVDGTASGIIATVGPQARSTTVEGLAGDKTHLFKVRAINGAGAGRRSLPSTAVEVPATVTDPAQFGSVEALVAHHVEVFLGRPATAAEVRALTTRVTDTADGPAEVVAEMSTSATYRTSRAPIYRLYQAILGRPPDASGLEYWARRLRRGTSVHVAARSIAGSSEFARRYPALSHDDFVRLVYRNVLRRDPDPGGFAYWTRRLQAGTDRALLVTSFSESRENQRRTADEVDVALLSLGILRRVPPQPTIDLAAIRRADGRSLAELAADLLRR